MNNNERFLSQANFNNANQVNSLQEVLFTENQDYSNSESLNNYILFKVEDIPSYKVNLVIPVESELDNDEELEDDWKSQAACAGLNYNLFFDLFDIGEKLLDDETRALRSQVRRICFECEVRVCCLEDALLIRDRCDGLRGGLTFNQRHSLIRKRYRARRKIAASNPDYSKALQEYSQPPQT